MPETDPRTAHHLRTLDEAIDGGLSETIQRICIWRALGVLPIPYTPEGRELDDALKLYRAALELTPDQPARAQAAAALLEAIAAYIDA